MKDQVTSIEKSPDVTERLMSVVGKSSLLRTLDRCASRYYDILGHYATIILIEQFCFYFLIIHHVNDRILVLTACFVRLRTLTNCNHSEQKDMIVKAFSGPLIKQPGEDVIVQGDIGDVYYLLEDGAVDVYIKKKGQETETKVHTYKAGDAFGELAIMYNAPRAATCRAQTESKLWALDRVSFKVIVVAAAMQKREIYIGFLQQVPILSSLTEMEVMTLADSLSEESYNDGNNISTLYRIHTVTRTSVCTVCRWCRAYYIL